MLAFALVAPLLAAEPAAPAPARVGRPFGLEAGVSLAAPMAGLGPGPGVRVLGEGGITPRFGAGLELTARFPGVASGTIGGDPMLEDLEWQTGLTVLAGGPRVSFAFGPLEKFHGRAALAGGVAWVAQDTVTQVGPTHDAVLTGWVQPEVGMMLPLGPGWLTADLYVAVAPAGLLVLGPESGGTAPGLAVGYRWQP